MKTELTKTIEQAIYSAVGADRLGVYGCYEVSFGKGYGDQYCDFVTMTSDNIFRCYEIKVTTSDFHSKCKLSFVGDFNYFVLPAELSATSDTTATPVASATTVYPDEFNFTASPSVVNLGTATVPADSVAMLKTFAANYNTVKRFRY